MGQRYPILPPHALKHAPTTAGEGASGASFPAPRRVPTQRGLVVMGVAGCGKTSVGQALAGALGWAFIEGDAHHSPGSILKMQAGQPLADEDRWGWLDRLGGLLAERSPVVLSCSALKRAYRDRLRAACPSLGFVYLEIDRTLALQRVAARSANHIFPTSLVDSQFQTLEPPTGEPGVVTVSAALPLAEQLPRVLDLLAHQENGA